jgi:catechol 2,3-dioxygenase-like lactoylglutathione lyase family enzyme
MLGNAQVVATIRCEDMTKQQRFYGEVLGLKAVKRYETGEVAFEAGGGTRIVLYPGPALHAEHTLAAFQVPDLEGEIKALEARGVVFEDFDLPDLKTVNHVAASKDVKCAWFRDPENNFLSLTQRAQ